MYPSILQYIDSLLYSEGLLNTLGDFKIVLNNNEEPIFSSGNFGVVFKVERQGHFYALKCFTREQLGRKSAYINICKEFNKSRQYTVKVDFYDNEIKVFYKDGTMHTFPVVVMDWVEGETMTRAIHKAVMANDVDKLQRLSYKFEAFARWLLSQSFAHGDIKPDNIIVNNNNELVLVDYDGMFMPNMVGQPQRELGTYGFQHYDRASMKLCKEIDHYSIAVLAVTLRVLAKFPDMFVKFGNGVNIFDPYKLIAGVDPCFNYLAKGIFKDDPLFNSLPSKTPVISGIMDMLYKDDPTREIEIVAKKDAKVRKKVTSFNKTGFVDVDNNLLIERRFDFAENFVDGYAVVCLKRRWGVIDTNGEVVIPVVYDRVGNVSEGKFAVSLNGKWGYVEVGMKKPIALKFDNAWSFRHSRALVKRREKYGFVDHDGKIVIPIKFDYAQSFTEGVACVKKDGKFGFIDVDGKWVVKPLYDHAQSVLDGLANVKLGDQSLVLDVKCSNIFEDE